MTPEKLKRLAILQHLEPQGLSNKMQDEMIALRRELAIEQQEKADDPLTPFVDESSRPQLDGSNYNDTLRQMCCDEVGALVLKYGRVVVVAALQAALTKR